MNPRDRAARTSSSKQHVGRNGAASHPRACNGDAFDADQSVFTAEIEYGGHVARIHVEIATEDQSFGGAPFDAIRAPQKGRRRAPGQAAPCGLLLV